MPQQNMTHAIQSSTLSDVLERVLDKGIVIAGDITISLATDVSRPDERYAGLPPAQWACLGAFALGLWLLRRVSPLLEFTGPPSHAVSEDAEKAKA